MKTETGKLVCAKCGNKLSRIRLGFPYQPECNQEGINDNDIASIRYFYYCNKCDINIPFKNMIQKHET